jgi:hypothetical protein
MNSGNTTRPTRPAQPVMVEDTAYIAAMAGSSAPTTSDAKPVSEQGPYLGLPTEDAARKRLKLWTFMFDYFPDAWLAIVEVAVAGNEQHNKGQPMHWAREKSTDQMNTAFRHQWDYGRGVKRDTDGQYHLAKAAWRLMAQLQLDIEADRAKA